MNKAYMKGYRKERNIVLNARARGCVAFRSAGSHSPIDVCSIDENKRQIELIQAKSDNLPPSQKRKIEQSLKNLEGLYFVKIRVL